MALRSLFFIMPRPQQSQAHTSAKRSKPIPVTAASKRRPTKRTTPRRPSTRNHKSAEAKLERDALDEKVIRLLSLKKHKAEGLLKADIAAELSADASSIKASLNRLVEMKLVETNGTTMNTKYCAIKDAVGKLKELRRAKEKPTTKQSAKRSSKRTSPAPLKSTAATRSSVKSGPDDEEE